MHGRQSEMEVEVASVCGPTNIVGAPFASLYAQQLTRFNPYALYIAAYSALALNMPSATFYASISVLPLLT